MVGCRTTTMVMNKMDDHVEVGGRGMRTAVATIKMTATKLALLLKVVGVRFAFGSP